MAESSIWSNSDSYEAMMGRWSRRAAEIALQWLDMPPGLRWLDVGCGTGALTRAIVSQSDPREIVGIDPSTEFLQEARQHVGDAPVTFLPGSLDDLPVADDQFDVVLSGLVLHFIADALQAVRAMARAARPGGTIASYIWAIASEDQFTRPFWTAAIELDPDASQWDPFATHILTDEKVLEQVFSDVPLDSVASERLAFPVVFRDFDDYWQPCLMNGPTPIQRYTASLDSRQRRALASQLQQLLPTESDGSIHLRGILWIARGENPESPQIG